MPKRSRKNLNVAVVGAGGRMGKTIIGLLKRERGLKFACGIDQSKEWPQGRQAKTVDGVIEFSSPEGLRDALDWCVRFRKPIVAGATGLTAADFRRLKVASRKIPVLYSANMSLGVAIMKAMINHFAAVPNWRYRMEETHHKKKKDKPSGTAKMLAAALAESTGKKGLPIISHRRGNVPGTHEILAEGPEESLRISHVAHDRRIFARGAIAAARWLFDKGKPGLYDINDLYKGR